MYLVLLKEKLATLLQVDSSDLVYPLQPDLGDLSLPMFTAAKISGVNPALLAQTRAESLQASLELKNLVSRVQATGPYLNFFLNPLALVAGAINDVSREGDKFGWAELERPERIMLEYSNANTHKEYHVGHLRNLFFGDAVTRILSANGYQAIPVSYINDFGIHVAKTLWHWQRTPAYAQQTGPQGRLLGECYSQAASLLNDNEAAKAEVGETMKAIESRRGTTYQLWQETRSWSIAYFAEIYERLGIKFDHIFYESEVIEEGLRIVEEFLQRGIFVRSQGAVIADLEAYGLGVMPIIRSDGTALYPVADLALARQKFQQYNLQESIYIVDVRQGLHFRQLAQIFVLAGEKFQITHLGYDFVTLKNGMMSSRSGNVITYDQILGEACSRANKEVSARHEDWSAEKIELTSEALAIAALKFEMLKVSADKVITFDVDEALRFDGYTAAYLQYTGARLASIMRKAAIDVTGADLSSLTHPKEGSLALRLEQFPEVVVKSGKQRDPSIIARYLFELAQACNDYYHEVNILKAEPAVAADRLALLQSIRQVLSNGFNLLGFSYLEEM